MNKEQQDLAWACLPKEARNNILSDYEYHLKRYEAVKRQHSKGVIDALEDLFGKDNLTSDTEPEEMLMVSRSEVQEAYKAVVSDMRRSVLFELFGKKCLSDKKESKPKFDIGQKVRAKGTKQIGTIKEPYSNDIGYRVYFEDGDGGWDKEYSADELEPYTEENKEIMEVKFNLGDKVEVDDEDDERIYTVIDILEREGEILYKLHHGECKERIEMAHLLKLYTESKNMEEIKDYPPYLDLPKKIVPTQEERLNLGEILKGHERESFYNPLIGSIVFVEAKDGLLFFKYGNSLISLPYTGLNLDGKLDIFPSKDQRDWNKWDKKYNKKTPKTWKDIENYVGFNNGNDYCIDVTGNFTRRNTPIEKSALALLKIHQLIEVGYGGNVSNEEWNKACQPNCNIFGITYSINTKSLEIRIYSSSKSIIAFHTYKQAEEFLKYPENIQLLRDYFQINE